MSKLKQVGKRDRQKIKALEAYGKVTLLYAWHPSILIDFPEGGGFSASGKTWSKAIENAERILEEDY